MTDATLGPSIAFDLSALMGESYQTVTGTGDTYFLTVCGTSPRTCPGDEGIPPVTKGAAVQITESEECFVLGDYEGDQCQWGANPGGREGIELILEDGSSALCSDGMPREITIEFLCPANEGAAGPLVPLTWNASNNEDSCDYTYTFETCAACADGCKESPPPPPPPVTPSPSMVNGGAGFGFWFFVIIFGIALPLYIFGAIFYNFQVKGARGADVMKLTPRLWGALFINIKAGISFTLSGFQTTGRAGAREDIGKGYSVGPDMRPDASVAEHYGTL
jgi:hypothetical protein